MDNKSDLLLFVGFFAFFQQHSYDVWKLTVLLEEKVLPFRF